MKYPRCPECGYMHPKKPSNRPRKYTAREEKKIIEDSKKMTLSQVANEWGCAIGTVSNIIKRNK